MEIKEFSFEFNELNVSVSDIEFFIGESPDLNEYLFDLINQALSEAPDLCEIKGGWRFFDSIGIQNEKNLILVGGKKFEVGKIVSTQLKKSASAALFLCTAGEKISAKSKELMAGGKMMEGYILDIIGSVTVERAMDKIQDFLWAEMKVFGMGISDRFSPGYCDWDVAGQQKLFSLFPANFCGVTLSESSMMNPIKSVSGIIGIGKELRQKGYQCNQCDDKKCLYGRIKRRTTEG